MRRGSRHQKEPNGEQGGATVIAAVAIGMLLLLGNLALSVSNTAQLRAESAGSLHSNEVLLALDNVLTLAKDAESGQRGYVITGRPSISSPTAARSRRSARSSMRSGG